MKVWVDGAIVRDAAAPAVAAGAVAPFETMRAAGGALPLWDRHVRRLAAAAARLRLPLPDLAAARAAAGELLRQNGHADDVLRLSLVPRAGRVHTVLATRARGPVRGTVRIVPCVARRPAGAPPADLKAFPRRFYDAVRQEAQDGGADDGVVVGDDGAVLETALANLWLRLGGGWVTPPLDGRVLPGIARAVLLERAAAAGLAVRERPCDLGDLHAAAAIAVSNAVHGPRAAALLGGPPASVEIVDTELCSLWRAAASG